MSEKYSLIEKTIEYNTNDEVTSAKPGTLVAGSQNVLIDGKEGTAFIRGGYFRLGAANPALTPVRNAVTWQTSKGNERPMRMYDDELEVYLGTEDGVVIGAWKRVAQSWSTTAKMRFATWFDDTENIDLLLFVQGDANIYEWNGAVSVIASITTNTITKTGSNTFAQNRFYTTRNKTIVNTRTGTTYTYTGGEGTLTLTGVSPDPTGDVVAGDVLVQQVVTNSNKPVASHTNTHIFGFQNQIYIGSSDDEQILISKNTDFTSYSYSAPRVSGEGGLLTLTDPCRGFGNLAGIAITFCGESSAFKSVYTEITVGTSLTESLTALPLKIGIKQGALNQETIVPIGDSLAYLSNEPALRIVETVNGFEEPQLKSLSYPIKPDFDNEDFTDSFATWDKNRYYLSSSVNSRLYILEYTQDADGSIRRYWHPPQILPIGALSTINDLLHFHSNSIPESYELFNGLSDNAYSGMDPVNKIPIFAVARYSYQTFGKRGNLKTFDEFLVEGNISPQTDDLSLILNYDFDGSTQQVEKIIDGTDEDILRSVVIVNSLGTNSLGTNPLGGSLDMPDDSRRFKVIFEIAKEDFEELQPIFSTNSVDRYWEIVGFGPNVALSNKKNVKIKK